MACNTKTCPDFIPDGRGLSGAGFGVKMRRENYPQRKTEAINAPSWHRDAVMYYYEDICDYPTVNTGTSSSTGGETTTDPQTGQTTTSPTATTEEVFAEAEVYGPSSGKIYKYLGYPGYPFWWGSFGCTARTSYTTGTGETTQEDPVLTRYWDHRPSELSFEPNYSDSGWIYIFDTEQSHTGLPCHALCWTTVENACPSEGGNTYTSYTYKAVRVPYECDQTPDETYIRYQTPDGKITGEEYDDPYPLIFSVGTKSAKIVYRDLGGCNLTAFGDVEMRFEGRIDKEDYQRYGPWTKLYSRSNGATGKELFNNLGVPGGFLSSENSTYTFTAEAKQGTTVVAQIQMSARAYQGVGDPSKDDSLMKVLSVTQVGDLPKAGRVYDLYAPKQTNSSVIQIGQVRFSNLSDTLASESTGCISVGTEYFLYTKGTDIATEYSSNNSWAKVELGTTVVNQIGSSVWSPGNSGLDSLTQIFEFPGSSAIYGPTTGSGLKLEIKLEKLADYESDKDTKVTIERIISSGDGKYGSGSVFPITFSAGGSNYTAGYLKTGDSEIVRGEVYKGIPVSFRVAEPRTDGGTFNITHSSWTTWANNYAVWTNDDQNNLAGRSVEVISRKVSLEAGSYTVDFGADDAGSVEILDSTTGTPLHSSGLHTGGLTGTRYTGTFTLSEAKEVDIYVDISNQGSGFWDENPAGWAITLTRSGSVVWNTRTSGQIMDGDAWVGSNIDDTKWKNAWSGASGPTFLSTQGDNVWKTAGVEVNQDYDFPGGLKLRFNIKSRYDSGSGSYQTAWKITDVVNYGSGYNLRDGDDYTKNGTVLADQDKYYIYYPSKDAPVNERISLAVMISQVTDGLAANPVDKLAIGDEINGWEVKEIHNPNDEMPYSVALLDGSGSSFAKDADYTSTTSGVSIKVLAGYGIKDRAVLVGQYEFNKKKIAYLTGRLYEDIPFEPEIIMPEMTAVITNGKLSDVQITRAGFGLSHPNIADIVLNVDDPPTKFDHARFNQLMLDGEVATRAMEACQGPGRQAQVKPVIVAGRLTDVIIVDGGSGYSSANPPKIRVPYVASRDKDVVWEASSAEQKEQTNKTLMESSPVFDLMKQTPYKRIRPEVDQNGNIISQTTEELPGYDWAEYSKDRQAAYNEQRSTVDRTSLKSVDLTDIPIAYELPSQLKYWNRKEVVATLEPEYLNQFDSRGKTSYEFSSTTQAEYDDARQNLSKPFQSSADSTKAANSSSLSTTSVPDVDLDSVVPNTSTLISDAQKASNIDTNTNQIGPSGNMDYYSNSFRGFLSADVEIPDSVWDLGPNNGPGQSPGLGLNEAEIYAQAERASNIGPTANQQREKRRNNNIDLSKLDSINKDYENNLERNTKAASAEDRRWDTVKTRIDTVEGGFYKLPCADRYKKYLMHEFCPDPRENVFMTVILGAKFNPPHPDWGRCTQCLYDDPAVVANYEANEEIDGYTIADAFCALNRADYALAAAWNTYTPSYFASFYASNAVIEGIGDWEIRGSLEILHDHSQEAKMWSKCCSSYGNPYDGMCGRNYGDSGENYKYSPDAAGELSDDTSAQLAEPIVGEI